MGVVPFCWASGVFDGIQRVYRIAYTTKRKAAPPGRHGRDCRFRGRFSTTKIRLPAPGGPFVASGKVG